MRTPLSFLFILFLTLTTYQAVAQCDPNEIFDNDSIPAICEEVDNNVRRFYANNLPPHPAGPWPTGNVPVPKDNTFQMCAYPIQGSTPTSIYGQNQNLPGCRDIYRIGISYNSSYFAAWAALYFENPNTGEENLDWNVEATTLNLDDYGSHVAGDDYHYHIPPALYYQDSLDIDGSEHSPILGYAADGFPMYFKYGYQDPMDPNSPVVALNSCFELISGNRPGDGITAPDGPYDGTYAEDWEHLPSGSCQLDECNGRFGVTPEFPNGTYYYVMTEEFPYMPRCLYGTVLDNTFRVGPNCPPSEAENLCSPLTVGVGSYLSTEFDVSFSPNPTTGVINISTSNDELFYEVAETISVYDVQGRVVLNQSPSKTVDLSSLPNGVFYIEVQSGSRSFTEKIILNK